MFTGIITDIGTIRSAQQRGDLHVGSPVNLEIDVLARYLARMRDHAAASGGGAGLS